jgi:hypothetical protein
MRILTLWQPYATFMQLGIKQWETRPPSINWDAYRGETLIHAASATSHRMNAEEWELVRSLQSEGIIPVFGEVPYGAILALTQMIDSQIMTQEFINSVSELERKVGYWSEGRKAVHCSDTTALTPIPWKGAQGLRKVPPELEKMVRQQLRGDTDV